MLRYKIIPVTPFEQNCSVLWCDATRKAAFVAKWKGVAAGYPDAALDAKLRPLGLKASDLK